MKLKYIKLIIDFKLSLVFKKFSKKIISPGEFLVSTKNGLFYINNYRLFKIMNGEFYGITTISKSQFFIYQKGLNNGKIFLLEKVKNKFVYKKTMLKNLSDGIHQIDFVNNKLFVANTYNNSVDIYQYDYNLNSLHKIDDIYPNGRLVKGRRSENYSHLNSIFLENEMLYILFHNETSKSNKPSDIFVYDLKKSKVVQTIKTDSGNAHNILIYENNLFHLDSMGKQIKVNNLSYLKLDKFLRGLSVSTNFITVGGSDYAKREDRNSAKGCIYFLSHRFKLLEVVTIDGMVQEIRKIDSVDFSLSSNSFILNKTKGEKH